MPGTKTNVLWDKLILKDSARSEERLTSVKAVLVLGGHCFPQYDCSGGCLGQCSRLENDLITEREYIEGKGHMRSINCRSQ